MKVLIIGYLWPEVTSSAAGLRTWNLVESLRQAKFQIHFASSAKRNEHTEALGELGVSLYDIEPNDPRFDPWIRELSPDVVLFDRFMTEEQFSWRVRENAPHALRVLDTIDLHFLRRARESAFRAGIEPHVAELNLNTDTAFREVASIERSDLSLILSDFEISLLESRFGVSSESLFLSRLHYEPCESPPLFEDRKNFVFIGNFRHAPNADAVGFLQKEIWPLIRKSLPEAELHIYGAYIPKEFSSLDSKKAGFRMMGHAENAPLCLAKYRVNLAPLRFGAGIKGKLSDGWWSGTPSVSTAIGAEGMVEDYPFPGAVTDSAKSFAEAAASLYSNEAAWKEARANALNVMANLYHRRVNSERFIQALQSAQRDLEAKRARSFTGQMLWHHTMQSTRYLSKWIEEKNQKNLAIGIPKETPKLLE